MSEEQSYQSRPTIVVAESPTHIARVERELTRRYAGDYDIVCTASMSEARAALRSARERGRPVAAVLAAPGISGVSGIQFLEEAHDIHPGAKRALLCTFGERENAGAGGPQAAALARIDAFFMRPAFSPDESFHRGVTELLEQWSRQERPAFEAVRVIGQQWSPRSHEMRDLLQRNAIPFRFIPSDSDEGEQLLAGLRRGPQDLPVVTLYTGEVFANPSLAEIADALGASVDVEAQDYDLAVAGAGPSGLAAAVYAASEGLRTLVIEAEAVGGQAGTSSMIRNYLGFATGISGADLAKRAYVQACLLGAHFHFGRRAVSIGRSDSHLDLLLSDGKRVRTRAALLATGAAYRRIGIPALERLAGAGVFYGAATTEAAMMRDHHVIVVGGGNSAGQAALHLARYASRVSMLVRGDSLATSMSDYLIREIERHPRIDLRTRTRVVDGKGESRLESVVIEDGATGALREEQADGLFVMIGAEPHTDWLGDAVLRDRWGFVLTGPEVPGNSNRALSLETSASGVFAVGDVRHGSVKRVASAAGEGSVVVMQVHEYLGRS